MDLGLRALLAGVVAGLAVAVPLGAIGVLILQEGLGRGWRHASAAATGVALVDLAYAGLATAAGTAVTRALETHTRTIQLVGAGVLLAVAARGLFGLRTEPGPAPAAAATQAGGPSPSGPGPAGEPSPSGPGPTAVLRRFVALTAVNPLTAVYFVVLAAGLGSTVAGARAGTAFVLGVFVGSWVWQLTLAAAGSLAGASLPGWARTATGAVGYLMVIGYAVTLAAG
jgi:arginine exporter protein ArgO